MVTRGRAAETGPIRSMLAGMQVCTYLCGGRAGRRMAARAGGRGRRCHRPRWRGVSRGFGRAESASMKPRPSRASPVSLGARIRARAPEMTVGEARRCGATARRATRNWLSLLEVGRASQGPMGSSDAARTAAATLCGRRSRVAGTYGLIGRCQGSARRAGLGAARVLRPPDRMLPADAASGCQRLPAVVPILALPE